MFFHFFFSVKISQIPNMCSPEKNKKASWATQNWTLVKEKDQKNDAFISGKRKKKINFFEYNQGQRAAVRTERTCTAFRAQDRLM